MLGGSVPPDFAVPQCQHRPQKASRPQEPTRLAFPGKADSYGWKESHLPGALTPQHQLVHLSLLSAHAALSLIHLPDPALSKERFSSSDAKTLLCKRRARSLGEPPVSQCPLTPAPLSRHARLPHAPRDSLPLCSCCTIRAQFSPTLP